MAAVETVAAEKPAAVAEQATSKGEIAVIAPPRLPYHKLIEERFGIDKAAWRALIDAVFPAAKSTDSVILALSYCKARRLDPFKRVVHIVPVWDADKNAYVETVWPGIAEHRTTAFRTKQYGGADAAQFGPNVTREFKGQTRRGAVAVTMTFPEWAQLTVYRLVDGQRLPMPGPRVYWLETFSRMGRADVPNERWQRAPFQMIEKCAEAAALRRAFPEEIGDDLTSDEVGAQQPGDDLIDVTPPARPTREEFKETASDASVAGGAETAAEPQQEEKPAAEAHTFELYDEQGEMVKATSDGTAWAQEFSARLIAAAEAANGQALATIWENNNGQLRNLPGDMEKAVREDYEAAGKTLHLKKANAKGSKAPADKLV